MGKETDTENLLKREKLDWRMILLVGECLKWDES
jgi:hypothetical protein